ncbi:hypothetical protein [Caballeronia zhejiangensis]|uniref:hypothetical protein n=1 Tax=Caballeronia zhejiangensis TaxID=871203 RepID=UPI00126830B9|nr:hypothetical protein [Caballeronia zhejiangensis]
MNSKNAVERVNGSDGKSYPASYTAHRDAIRRAIEADPHATNTAIAKRMHSARDTVIAVRREIAGQIVDARYAAMCTAIAECYRVDEVKDLRDKARALEVYTRQAQNREAERRAAEIRLRAERRAGELLLKQTKAEGTRSQLRGRDASGGRIERPPEARAQTLREKGISKDQGSDWQKLATLPEQTFEAALADQKQPPTTTSLVKLATQAGPRYSVTAMDGSTSMNPMSLWVWDLVRGFERKCLAQEEPIAVFGGMTQTMQADLARLVPGLLDWFARLPIDTVKP